MRDPELELLSILLFCGLCWLIFRYYWLRVLTGAFGLAGWGAATIALPLFLAWRYALDGRPLLAVVALVVSIMPAALWCVAATAAASWMKTQHRYGRLWRPWNAI